MKKDEIKAGDMQIKVRNIKTKKEGWINSWDLAKAIYMVMFDQQIKSSEQTK